MGNHVHLLVEADDKNALSSGMRSFNTRLAQGVNRALRRTGSVVAGRFHSRALKQPPEVRNVLVYVLLNWQKHFGSGASIPARAVAGSMAGNTPSRFAGRRRPSLWRRRGC